ncbi:hypothetical protein NEOKW01_1347 [Nematocida sp. AWRm80]|nr:hypothetical protein NEOKW01_1347 [Nematocida sp. AWRm80]
MEPEKSSKINIRYNSENIINDIKRIIKSREPQKEEAPQTQDDKDTLAILIIREIEKNILITEKTSDSDLNEAFSKGVEVSIDTLDTLTKDKEYKDAIDNLINCVKQANNDPSNADLTKAINIALEKCLDSKFKSVEKYADMHNQAIQESNILKSSYVHIDPKEYWLYNKEYLLEQTYRHIKIYDILNIQVPQLQMELEKRFGKNQIDNLLKNDVNTLDVFKDKVVSVDISTKIPSIINNINELLMDGTASIKDIESHTEDINILKAAVHNKKEILELYNFNMPIDWYTSTISLFTEAMIGTKTIINDFMVTFKDTSRFIKSHFTALYNKIKEDNAHINLNNRLSEYMGILSSVEQNANTDPYIKQYTQEILDYTQVIYDKGVYKKYLPIPEEDEEPTKQAILENKTILAIPIEELEPVKESSIATRISENVTNIGIHGRNMASAAVSSVKSRGAQIVGTASNAASNISKESSVSSINKFIFGFLGISLLVLLILLVVIVSISQSSVNNSINL